jgi:transcriptional regulator with XRE-family HTH domain
VDRGRFGHWLDVTMDNEGVQGKDLAAYTKVTSGAVSRWRNGQSIPSPDNLRDLATYLSKDPLRVMATAGVPGIAEAGIEPYDIPPAQARREKARDELSKLKRLNREERQFLVEAYDRYLREQKTKTEKKDHRETAK